VEANAFTLGVPLLPVLLGGRRRAYPDSLKITEPALRLMVSDRAEAVTRDCLFAKKAFAYSALGEPKEKCMMGVKADCSRFG
jgi:hypothetical protein